MRVRGPFRDMDQPTVKHLDFSPGKPKAQPVDFDIIPRSVPFCPVEVVFVSDETNDSYTSFPIPVILDVIK